MRVLIRNASTNEFLIGEDAWTSDRNLGRDFAQSSKAVSFVLDKRLTGVEVLLDFGNQVYDITLHSFPCSGD